MTVKEHWLKYKLACYPEGCTVIQERECRQAFFTGALIILGPVLDEISLLPNNDLSAVALEIICLEVMGECKEHAISNFNKRN